MSKKYRSSQEAELLIVNNFGLLISVAQGFNPRNHTELDNYISAGSLGIVRAAYSFNPEKAQFSTHATCCIKNEILKFIKYEKKHSHCLPMIDCVSTKIVITIDDFVPPNLTKQEKTILSMKREGCSNKEIQDELGLTKDKLRMRLKKLIAKFRECDLEA